MNRMCVGTLTLLLPLILGACAAVNVQQATSSVDTAAAIPKQRACLDPEISPPRNVSRRANVLTWQSGRFTWTATVDEQCRLPKDLSGMWLTTGFVRTDWDPISGRWLTSVSSSTRTVCTTNAFVTGIWSGFSAFGQERPYTCRLKNLQRLPNP